MALLAKAANPEVAEATPEALASLRNSRRDTATVSSFLSGLPVVGLGDIAKSRDDRMVKIRERLAWPML